MTWKNDFFLKTPEYYTKSFETYRIQKLSIDCSNIRSTDSLKRIWIIIRTINFNFYNNEKYDTQ